MYWFEIDYRLDIERMLEAERHQGQNLQAYQN
jgi:hypothetical protein